MLGKVKKFFDKFLVLACEGSCVEGFGAFSSKTLLGPLFSPRYPLVVSPARFEHAAWTPT
jgi:hypothetical protein